MKAKPAEYINIMPGSFECSPKLDFPKAMQLIKSVELAFMRGLMDSVEKDKTNTPAQNKQFKEDLYDAYNQAASSVLFQFAPELEIRPDLTVEAIAKAQEELLENKTDEELVRLVIGDDECIENLKNARDVAQT